jgi:hypothetical protein
MDETFIKKLKQVFEPDTTVSLRIKEKDIVVKTDRDGNAVHAFVGKIQPDGNIKGERYTRQLVKNKEGVIIKDHWDLKGKAS